MYLITIFTKDVSFLLGSVFFIIYLPLWEFVAERTHWLTKAIFYTIYGISWASFIFSNLGDWLDWGLPNLFLTPALLGWLLLFLLKDWAKGVER